MSLKSRVIPPVAALITSRRVRDARRVIADIRRRLWMKPNVVHVYLRIDDPYSHILVQVLEAFDKRYRVELELRAVQRLPEEMFPDRERLTTWARRDAGYVAELYDLEPPGPTRSSDDVHEASLALAEACQDGVVAAADVFATFASGAPAPSCRDRQAATHSLGENEKALVADGHYMSAMLHYPSEWYWGIDRLNHLERRLIGAELARGHDGTPTFIRRLPFLEAPAAALENPPPLIFYWSARSPYSYLALQRAVDLCEAFGVTLEIRPVLPMVMRNLEVPRTKRFYILLDGKREAALQDIPYGRVCDPLGEGIERCYAVFEYARESGTEVDWVLAFATAVWSEGVDAATDDGIGLIAERAGLDVKEAVARSRDQQWRERVERHRLEMLDGGFWGVPTLCFGDTWVWGQDRFWVLEQAMRKAGRDPHLAEGDQ